MPMLTVKCVCANTGGPGTVISDTASYSDDIFTLHFVIMSCITIYPFPKSPHYPNEPMIDDSVYLILSMVGSCKILSKLRIENDQAHLF